MLLELVKRKYQEPIELCFGLRSEQDIFWDEELESIKQDLPQFNYSIWLSQPSSTWPGRCGRITSGLQDLKHSSDSDYYICGNPQMVLSMVAALKGQGVPEEQIFFEKFDLALQK